ncbi:MAG: DUF177 domain-containing protein [Chloroflexi bacterium]|nr:DUF177 domain-containing protein [Chloroflexota bacterium]
MVRLQSLQFNVAGLMKGPLGGVREYDLRVPISEMDQIDESFDVTGPFIGSVHMLKASDTVLVRMEGSLTVRLVCSRCLELFDAEIPVVIEEEFRPSINLVTGRVVRDLGDDAAVVIDERHILDLTEVLRQSIVLALPVAPVCDPDCQGLCPVCGANRNTETCHCEADSIDPRWSALSVLLDDVKE